MIEDSAPPESMLLTNISPVTAYPFHSTYYLPSNFSTTTQFTPALCAEVSLEALPRKIPSGPGADEAALPSKRTRGAASMARSNWVVAARCTAWGLMVPRARPKRWEFMHQMDFMWESNDVTWGGSRRNYSLESSLIFQPGEPSTLQFLPQNSLCSMSSSHDQHLRVKSSFDNNRETSPPTHSSTRQKRQATVYDAVAGTVPPFSFLRPLPDPKTRC
jgi:hypothetical protein